MSSLVVLLSAHRTGRAWPLITRAGTSYVYMYLAGELIPGRDSITYVSQSRENDTYVNQAGEEACQAHIHCWRHA